MFKTSWIYGWLLLMTGLVPGRTRRPQRRRPRWVRPSIEALEDRCLLTVSIMEYAAPPVPLPDNGPDYMVAGLDGNVWFSEPLLGRVARITPTGITTEFATPAPPLPNGAGMGLAAGTDGIWFSGLHDIGELSFQGALLHDFVIPSASNSLSGLLMTLGPDGNLWYTEPYGNPVVGRLTPSGQITEWPIPFNALDIVRGSDGNLWFDSTGPGYIGRITPSGNRSYFDGLGGERGLTAGPDGNLWITNGDNNTIVRFNTNGVKTGVFSVPTPNSGLYGMGAGPDGNVWFTEGNSNQIGIIAPNGRITGLPIPTPNSGPDQIVAGPDGNVWFGEDNVNQIGEVVLNQTTAPVADAGGPYAITYGGPLTLDASALADPDGDALTYSWTINGHADAASGLNPTLTGSQLQALGVTSATQWFFVSVTADDGHGVSNTSARVQVNVNHVPPPLLTVNSSLPQASGGVVATNSGTWSDSTAGAVVTLSASLGTIQQNADGTWSWSYTTPSGPAVGQIVSIMAQDNNGGFAMLDFWLNANRILTVTNTGDNGGVDPLLGQGTGTLRQAIVDANAGGGPDVIAFNIPTSDPGYNGTIWTIGLNAGLDTINNPVIIDGYSQPGSSPNTRPLTGTDAGDNAARLIDIQGGLTIAGGNSTVNGLTLSGGVWITANGNDLVTGIDGGGVGIDFGVNNNTIGGITPGAHNVLSGGRGVAIYDSDNNIVEGNYIGVNPHTQQVYPGLLSMSSIPVGIIDQGYGNVIGSRGAGNVVGGYLWDILVGEFDDAPTGNTQVQGNYVGVNGLGEPLSIPQSDWDGIVAEVEVGGATGRE
jgi:streptogramin lyase